MQGAQVAAVFEREIVMASWQVWHRELRRWPGLASAVVLSLAFMGLGAAFAERGPNVPAASSGGDGGWMSDARLVATFTGRSIDGEYEDGDTFHESYAADGTVAYRDKRRTSGGKWSVRSGTFCTIYDDDPSGGCYRVRQESENCFEFHFVARTEAEAEKDPRKPDWTARGWFPDKPSTCIEGESV
jgi:hypothetical protein